MADLAFARRMNWHREGIPVAIPAPANEVDDGMKLDQIEYATILDQLGEGVIVTDATGRITFVNETAIRLHGVKRLDVEPDDYSDHYHLFTEDGEPYPPEKLPLTRAVRDAEIVSDARWMIRRPDGSEVLAIGTARPLFDADNRQSGAVLTIRDDTARHAAENQLARLNETLEQRITEAVAERESLEAAYRQSQKMEAVGQLTGGIAHDFNNLLTVISGSTELLAMRLSAHDDEKTHQHLLGIAKAADKAASLTQRLLAFSRRQPLDYRKTDINALIASLEELFARTIGETIMLQTDFSPGANVIHVDANQLENVLLNLALNARDAMPDGGVVTIRTARESLAERRDELLPGDYAVIAVSDTGTGMDEATRIQAFEPFFTTKGVGKGTGLGLSMIYGFAKQSGGDVEIDSRPGEGTTVRVLLPVDRPAPSPA